MRGGKRGAAQFPGTHPFSLDAGGGLVGPMNVGLDPISGKGIPNGQETGGAGLPRHGGQKKKPFPAVAGMLPGYPDFLSPFHEEDGFPERDGWRRFGAPGNPPTGGTAAFQGAGGAEGISWQADQGAQLHQGLVVKAGILLRDDFPRQATQIRKARRATAFGSQPSEHSRHVCIEGRGGNFEGDAGDGARGVIPDAGQLSQRLQIVGKFPAGKTEDRPGQGMEIPGPTIITQSLP